MSPPRSQRDHDNDIALAKELGEMTAQLKGLRDDMKEVKGSLGAGDKRFKELDARLAALESEVAVLKAEAEARSKARYWWLAAALALWSTVTTGICAAVAKWFTTTPPTPPSP